MEGRLHADASPEKRLFISLLTRDISMVAAFLDLIDNSVNAAVAPFSEKLRTAEEYIDLLQDAAIKPTVDIHVTLSRAACKTLIDSERRKNTQASSDVGARQLARF